MKREKMERVSTKYQQACILPFGQQRTANYPHREVPFNSGGSDHIQSLIILIKSALVVGVAKVWASTAVGLPAGGQGTHSNHCSPVGFRGSQ